MLPKIVTQIGVGTTLPAVLDIHRDPFNVGIGCVVTGTVTYTIQHTFDDVQTVASPTWFNHDDPALVNATANANSNFAFPCQAWRINVTAGSGQVTATVIQAGMRGS